MKKRTSIIWTIDKNKLQLLLDNSNSYVEVLQKLGYTGFTGNHKTLKNRIEFNNISTDKLTINRQTHRKQIIKNLQKINRIPDEKVFHENSTYITRTGLKKKLIAGGRLYECEECGLTDTWNNKKLSLQLDHKNGIYNDNRKENLRFLCPNCHSQTDTFGGRNAKQMQNCQVCNKEFHCYKHRKYCTECLPQIKSQNGENLRRFNPSKDELISKIIELKRNLCAVGRYYDVSDNAIRKRCKKLDIDWKKVNDET